MLRKLLIFLVGLFVITASIVHADTQTLTVTGTVVPRSSDFQLSITPSTSETLSQNKSTTYTITYGSNLLYADSITIEAYWSQGTVSGASTPTIDGLDYVSGSATNAYGSTTPIINLTSQKISWTISSFPSQTTNKQVTFQLKTNGNYTSTNSVTFPIKVRLIASNFTTPYQSTTTTYQYDSTQVTPTPTPSPNSSSGTTTSTANNNPTATPKIKRDTETDINSSRGSTQSLSSPTQNAAVQGVSIINLSDSDAEIAVTLNKTIEATLTYGLRPTALNLRKTVGIDKNDGLITISDLAADTTYYMQIISKDPKGTTTKSDVFAIQTAQASAQPQVAKASLVVASNNDVLYSAALSNQSHTPSGTLQTSPQIPVSQNANYSFAFKLTKQNKIKTVSMTLKNVSVLGIATFRPVIQPLEYSFPVLEKENGTYGVAVKNPTTPGIYDVYVRVTDYDGNITTEKVAEIRVLRPFRIYNATTKKPIEDARIVIYRYNEATQKYDILANFSGFQNPLYTNVLGEAGEQLPKDKYQMYVGRIGYAGKWAQFSIGLNPGDDFPTVYLTPKPVTPLSIFIYYRNAFSDYIGTTTMYVAAIQQSYRYFDLIGLLVVLCLIVISFLLFKMKSHIAFSHIPYYLHHHTLTLFGKKESPYLFGTVKDEQTKQALSGVHIYTIEEITNLVVSQTTTNKAGSFILPFDKTKKYMLSAIKEGYVPTHIGYAPGLVISLVRAETIKKRVIQIFLNAVQDGLGIFFEYILVLSVILEIFLFPAFGLARTIPFFLMSLLNIVLWSFYLREKGK